jgi:hypothetical protein
MEFKSGFKGLSMTLLTLGKAEVIPVYFLSLHWLTRCALLHSPAALLTAEGHLAPRRNETDRHETQSGCSDKKNV